MASSESLRQSSDDGAPPDPTVKALTKNPTRFAIWGMFILALFYTFYFAASLLIPIAFAIVFNIVLSPIPRLLSRYGVPVSLSAIGLVVMLVAVPVAGFYSLSGQVTEWVDRTPELVEELPRKLQKLRQPIDDVVKASEDIQEAAEGEGTVKEKPQEVIVSKGSTAGQLAKSLQGVGIGLVVSLFLLLLMLANGDLFTEKVIQASSRLTDKKRALRMSREISQQVANYLATVTLINVGLGVVMGIGMYLLGMPDPILLGTMAVLLNFVPYFGAIAGMVITGAISVVTFDTVSAALIPPLFYLVLNSIEGYLVTPTVLSRRLTVNSIVIFISVALFGFVWGIAGALLAVPIVVIAKVICDHVEQLQTVGQFLGGRQPFKSRRTPETATLTE